MSKEFKIGNIEVGQDKPFFVIAGPCVIESEKLCLDIAKRLVEIQKNTNTPIIFKASYDKANRTSIHSYRGVDLITGIKILQKVRKKYNLPILTDVHEVFHAILAAKSGDIDCLQIPAFLCRQTDLVTECASTGLPINVKKGQFLSPWEMKNIVEKIEYMDNNQILLTERGTCFGYNELVNDMKAIPIMQQLEYPVVFDATHSIQRPGSFGDMTGGYWEHSPVLARAAVAAGANGLFVEVHPDPGESKSDAATIMPIDWLEDLIIQCKKIQGVING